MWLLQTEAPHRLKSFSNDSPPKYSILSHRWGKDEVTFQEIQDDKFDRNGDGYKKILGACAVALRQGYQWIWIDTCCIDKKSTTELDEAINSMMDLYADADYSIAYLADVKAQDVRHGVEREIRSSNWFERGWTLQELIAPEEVWFYNRNWTCIGSRTDLCDVICQATRIDTEYLTHARSYKSASIAQRLSWASCRVTTKPEDIAYCLLGLLGIRLSLHYGEGGTHAFFRLQREILLRSQDQSIFAWLAADCDDNDAAYGILARSPRDFHWSRHIQRFVREPYYTLTYSYINGYLQFSQFTSDDDGNDETDGQASLLLACGFTEPPWEDAIKIELRKIKGTWYRVHCRSWPVEAWKHYKDSGFGVRQSFPCAAGPGSYWNAHVSRDALEKHILEHDARLRLERRYDRMHQIGSLVGKSALGLGAMGAIALAGRLIDHQRERRDEFERLSKRLQDLEVRRARSKLSSRQGMMELDLPMRTDVSQWRDGVKDPDQGDRDSGYHSFSRSGTESRQPSEQSRARGAESSHNSRCPS